MSLPAGYSSHPATWDDLEDLVRLFNACDRADVGFVDPVRDHIQDTWRDPSFDLAARSLVIVADDGSPAAYAEVSGHDPTRSLDGSGRVHPDHRGRGLGGAVLDWIERSAATAGAPRLFVAVASSVERARDLLVRRGHARVRTFWHMQADLGAPVSPEPPEGVTIRSYRHDEDVGVVYDAIEEAFQDHWEHEPYPYDLHAEEMLRVDPSLVSLAVGPRQVLGVAIGRVVEGVGWIDVVAVRRPWRRLGIGRALLLRTFDRLGARGVATALLNVDAESPTGATRLYESVGMRVRRSFDVYEKALALT